MANGYTQLLAYISNQIISIWSTRTLIIKTILWRRFATSELTW